MAVFVMGLVLLLAMAAHSDATYCVCNSGVSESVLQSNIDYACGAGADCSAISQNGACFNPNTVRDHCNYAVNSYYQRKGQVPGSCDFHGSATVTANPPSSVGSGCVYQSSPSNGGGTTTPTPGTSTPTPGTSTPTPGTSTPTPGTGTPTPGMGGTPNTGTGGTPNTGTGGTPNTGTGGTPNTGIGGTPNTGIGGSPNMGGSTNPGMVPGSTMSPPGFGLGPTGSGFGNTDSSISVKLLSRSSIASVALTLLISGLMCQRI
ncbi:hypothetical protein BUALT_Bualt17G0080100 [Buddleja alternifolia]|uniref:X8 domain-containing protein n=1 Tax=Buddleja alternifolia TaxID=168488 RepID=A0AAV6W7J8_9LAMI|nr:hypothetical protein BUALT_Bualt17G0080100 [Buddleja alternifolia]